MFKIRCNVGKWHDLFVAPNASRLLRDFSVEDPEFEGRTQEGVKVSRLAYREASERFQGRPRFVLLIADSQIDLKDLKLAILECAGDAIEIIVEADKINDVPSDCEKLYECCVGIERSYGKSTSIKVAAPLHRPNDSASVVPRPSRSWVPIVALWTSILALAGVVALFVLRRPMGGSPPPPDHLVRIIILEGVSNKLNDPSFLQELVAQLKEKTLTNVLAALPHLVLSTPDTKWANYYTISLNKVERKIEYANLLDERFEFIRSYEYWLDKSKELRPINRSFWSNLPTRTGAEPVGKVVVILHLRDRFSVQSNNQELILMRSVDAF